MVQTPKVNAYRNRCSFEAILMHNASHNMYCWCHWIDRSNSSKLILYVLCASEPMRVPYIVPSLEQFLHGSGWALNIRLTYSEIYDKTSGEWSVGTVSASAQCRWSVVDKCLLIKFIPQCCVFSAFFSATHLCCIRKKKNFLNKWHRMRRTKFSRWMCCLRRTTVSRVRLLSQPALLVPVAITIESRTES